MGQLSLFIDQVLGKIPVRLFVIPAVQVLVRQPLKDRVLSTGFYDGAFFSQWKAYPEVYLAEPGDLFISAFLLFFKIVGRKTNDLQLPLVLLVKLLQLTVLVGISTVAGGIDQ